MHTGKSIAGSNTHSANSDVTVQSWTLFLIVLLSLLSRFSSLGEIAEAQMTVDLGAVDKVLEMHASKIMLVFHQVRLSCCLL